MEHANIVALSQRERKKVKAGTRIEQERKRKNKRKNTNKTIESEWSQGQENGQEKCT